jgi:anti-anti-sigma factor
MSFEIVSGEDVLRVRGEMTIGNAAGLKEQLFAALAQRSEGTRIDLSHVSELDTSGLQILLMARVAATASGGQIAMVNPSVVVREVLNLCRATELVAETAELAETAETAESAEAIEEAAA